MLESFILGLAVGIPLGFILTVGGAWLGKRGGVVMNKPTVKRLKSITNFDILLAARGCGSVPQLAKRLQMPLPLLRSRLLVLKRRGVAVVFG